MGTVTVELELGADARKVVDEVKSSVDAITTFPVEAEKPIIRELTSRMQVADIAIFGDVALFTLKATAERVRDELTAIPGITQVEIVSAPPYEISIEVSEVALRRHGLTFDQIADAVRRSSLDMPGGSVRTEGGEILLRTLGQAYRGEEYENLVVWTRADGSRLRVGDVATVVDGFAETDQFARFDRTPTMMVSVFRTGDQSALELAALVHAYIDEAQTRLPDGLSLTIWQDSAQMLGNRLSLMLRTRRDRVRAGLCRARPLSRPAPRALGQSRDPDLVPRRARVDANLRHLHQHDVAVCVRHGAGHRGRRCHHRRREHLPASGRTWRRASRVDRGRTGDRQAGHLRGADDRRGLHAAAVRARHDGEESSASFR